MCKYFENFLCPTQDTSFETSFVFVFVFVFLCVFFGGCGGVCVRGGGILVFNIFTYANVFVS